MGYPVFRLGAFAALCLLVAGPVRAADDADNSDFTVVESDNAIIPPPSEEALVFTGQDEKPLTPPRNGFRGGIDNVVAGARAFSSWMGPETWMILIGGFALVGFAVRRSERVLRFEPNRENPRDDPIDRTDHPEHPKVASGPDASSPLHSGSDPAPSARPDQAE